MKKKTSREAECSGIREENPLLRLGCAWRRSRCPAGRGRSEWTAGAAAEVLLRRATDRPGLLPCIDVGTEIRRITTTDIARIPGRCCKQPAVRLVVLTVRLRQLLRHEKWKRLEAHRARTVNAVVIAVAPLDTAVYLHKRYSQLLCACFTPHFRLLCACSSYV